MDFTKEMIIDEMLNDIITSNDIIVVEAPNLGEVKKDVPEVEDKSHEWNVDMESKALQECHAKFSRFKEVVKKIDPSNEAMLAYKDTSLKVFLFTLRCQLGLNPKYNIDDCYFDMLKNANLTDEQVGPGVREHIKLFIDYFIRVTKTMD